MLACPLVADDTPNPTNMAKRGFWSVWDYLVKKGGADWLVPLLITTGGLGAILGVAKANWPLIIACAVLGLGFVCLVVISMRAVRPSTEAILKLTAAQATPPSWTDRPQRPSPSDRGCRIGAMLSLNRTALVCALLLVVAGCSQNTSSPTRDAGRDVVVTPHDSGEDVASPHDAGRDVAPPHDSGRDVASPRDAGRDVVLHHDAGRDVVLPHDAGPVDATHDAAPRDAAIV